MIKAIAAPYPQIKFIPTGGVNEKYDRILKLWLCFSDCASWMVKSDLIKNGQFTKIEDMTNGAVRILKEVR